MSKTKLEKELRYININPDEFLKVEKRAEGESEKDVMVLEGYPITFNQETTIGEGEDWGWIESIDPHALDGADMRDCCLKYNHNDTSPIMARTRNKSLILTPDEKGVHMRAELIDTQSNKDFYKMVKAGLLDKMSFAFTVEAEEVDSRSKPQKRIIKRIGKLFDVSAVDIPAYDTTSLIARSKAMAESVPVELENSTTKVAELENEASEGQKAQDEVRSEMAEAITDIDIVQETKPVDEERIKSFEVAKRKAQAKVKLMMGGYWND